MECQKQKKIKFFLVGISTAASILTLFLTTQLLAADWPMFGNDLLNSRFQNETILNAQNVSNLQVKWSAPVDGFFIKTCVMDQDSLYCATSNSPPIVPSGNVYKFNKANGSEAVPHRDIRSVISECLPGENLPSMFDMQTSPALSGNNLVVTVGHVTPATELFPSCPTVCLDDDGNPNTPCVPFLDPNLDPVLL